VSILSIEALPASIGAAFARGQLGQERGDRPATSYGHELFLMAAGAVVFASNIAPTEEIIVLAGAVTAAQAFLLVVLSLALMHVFMYGTGFAGQEESSSTSRAVLTLTVPGYVIALALSAFLLWSFGRYDGTSSYFALIEAFVLALPASLGAAAARLIL
jgi:putative integral membrane protein (TIGR02587 family)